MRAANIFLSSSSADRKVAARLLDAFRREGLEVALAPAGIERSASVRRSIDRAIRAADLIIVLVSQERPDEAQQALWPEVLSAVWDDPSKLILPLLLRGARVPPFVHSSARALPAIRLADPAGPRQIEAVCAAVKSAAHAASMTAALARPLGGVRRSALPIEAESAGPPSRDGRMEEIGRFVKTLKQHG